MADYFASKQKSRDAAELSGSERRSGSVAGIDILEVIVIGPFSIGLGSYLEVPRGFGRRLGTLVFEISIEDWYIFGSPRLSINLHAA